MSSKALITMYRNVRSKLDVSQRDSDFESFSEQQLDISYQEDLDSLRKYWCLPNQTTDISLVTKWVNIFNKASKDNKQARNKLAAIMLSQLSDTGVLDFPFNNKDNCDGDLSLILADYNKQKIDNVKQKSEDEDDGTKSVKTSKELKAQVTACIKKQLRLDTSKIENESEISDEEDDMVFSAVGKPELQKVIGVQRASKAGNISSPPGTQRSSAGKLDIADLLQQLDAEEDPEEAPKHKQEFPMKKSNQKFQICGLPSPLNEPTPSVESITPDVDNKSGEISNKRIWKLKGDCPNHSISNKNVKRITEDMRKRNDLLAQQLEERRHEIDGLQLQTKKSSTVMIRQRYESLGYESYVADLKKKIALSIRNVISLLESHLAQMKQELEISKRKSPKQKESGEVEKVPLLPRFEVDLGPETEYQVNLPSGIFHTLFAAILEDQDASPKRSDNSLQKPNEANSDCSLALSEMLHYEIKILDARFDAALYKRFEMFFDDRKNQFAAELTRSFDRMRRELNQRFVDAIETNAHQAHARRQSARVQCFTKLRQIFAEVYKSEPENAEIWKILDDLEDKYKQVTS